MIRNTVYRGIFVFKFQFNILLYLDLDDFRLRRFWSVLVIKEIETVIFQLTL
jgi:hypothetical protein